MPAGDLVAIVMPLSYAELIKMVTCIAQPIVIPLLLFTLCLKAVNGVACIGIFSKPVAIGILVGRAMGP